MQGGVSSTPGEISIYKPPKIDTNRASKDLDLYMTILLEMQ
jgi:hypothetical protein